MKNKTFLGIFLALALANLARAASVTNAGPPTLHYLTHNHLFDPATNVVGSLKLDYYDKGKGILQKLDVLVTNLTPYTTYWLTAVLGADTNPVTVVSFITDKKGKAKIGYLDLPNGGGSGGNTNKIMPPALLPLLAVHGIGVADSLGTTLAFSWIDNAVLYQFQMKRNLTAVDPFGTAAGSIDLKSNPTGTNFKLKAGGLTPGSIHLLSLNSIVMNATLSDLKGRLQMIGWPPGAPAGPALRTLDVLDSLSNIVLTTTVP